MGFRLSILDGHPKLKDSKLLIDCSAYSNNIFTLFKMGNKEDFYNERLLNCEDYDKKNSKCCGMFMCDQYFMQNWHRITIDMLKKCPQEVFDGTPNIICKFFKDEYMDNIKDWDNFFKNIKKWNNIEFLLSQPHKEEIWVNIS